MYLHFGAEIIVELSCYYLYDIFGMRMSDWQREDFSYFGEASADSEDDALRCYFNNQFVVV